MKRKSNNKTKAIVVLSAAALLAVGVGVGIKSNGFRDWNVDTWFTGEVKEADQKGNLRDDIKAQGMTIKRLSSVTNQDGSIANTYSYSITPANAARKDMTISIAWNGQTDAVIGNFLTATIDSSAQTFTITKLADFATQAKVTIQSVANDSVKAEILVDCKQVFNGFGANLTQSVTQKLTANAGIDIDTISANGATAAGVGNVTSVYTIALDQYTISNPSATLHGYVTGNNAASLADSGLTIGNDWAVKAFDFADDFSLSELQTMVSSDAAKMSEQNRLAFEGNAYFGVSYQINATISFAGQSANVKANIVAYADVADLDFGSVPSGITPEDSHIVFNDDSSSSSSSEAPVAEYTYFLERAADSNANSEVLQTIQMTEDGGWYFTNEYTIEYGQAFRVRIHCSDGTDDYSDEAFAWGNTNGGGVFAYSDSGDTWDNAIQDLGHGLYYVSLS